LFDWTPSLDVPKEACSCGMCILLVRDGHNMCFSRPQPANGWLVNDTSYGAAKISVDELEPLSNTCLNGREVRSHGADL
jgi:hypothetical protein